MKRSRYSPSVPQQPARCVSTRLNGNASCPAGTGVCVVKTVVRRTSSSASSNDSPDSMQIADALQHDERGVPFVQVPDRRRRAERLERADAADAEDDFLLDARLAVAAVEPRRQLAVPRRVLLEIGVEQVQLHAAEPHAPHLHQHAAVAERHRDDAGLAVGGDGRLDRRVVPVQALVRFLLPAFRRHALVEVALRIHEADADERHAEVARLLAVIAGEHAEAAGVDRQRLVQRELRREVGDRPGAVRRSGAATTCPARCARGRAPRSPRRRPPGTARRCAASSSSSCETLRSISTGLCAVCRHSG